MATPTSGFDWQSSMRTSTGTFWLNSFSMTPPLAFHSSTAMINPCFRATPASAAGPVRGAVMPILIAFGGAAARHVPAEATMPANTAKNKSYYLPFLPC